MRKVWYENYEENFLEVMKYYNNVINRAKDDNRIKKFFEEYEKVLITEFIFESNLIEKEGLSKHDTKKLVVENYDDIFDNLRNQTLKSLNVEDIRFRVLENKRIACIHKDKQKDVYLVINQLIAVLLAENLSLKAHNINLKRLLCMKEILTIKLEKLIHGKEKNSNTDIRQRELKKQLADIESQLGIFQEEDIKSIHKELSSESSNNNNGFPGEYRPEAAYIDFDTVFMEPSLITNAMRQLVRKHKKRIFNIKTYNTILEGCKVAADIVKIHPFGDFNGRTSRIVLNAIVRSEGFPLYVILEGNGKRREKYMRAMKMYYRKKDLRPFISLVCMCILERINIINDKFELAGVETINKKEFSDKERNRYIEILNEYLK